MKEKFELQNNHFIQLQNRDESDITERKDKIKQDEQDKKLYNDKLTILNEKIVQNKIELVDEDKAKEDVNTLAKLEAKIERANKDLSDLAVRHGISPKPLLDYFHTLLLSPITGYRQKNTKADLPEVNHNKTIHGSDHIPFEAKREYYQKMEELYDRAFAGDVQLKVEPKDRPNIQLDVEKRRNEPVLETINEVIDSDALSLMALNDHMVKEVKQFRKNMDDHRVLSENFNEWFKYFTSILSGGIIPRSADTIKFDDVVAINKYIDGIRDPYGLKFKLKYWYLDPRFVDEKLSSKGMFKPYYAYHGLVQTSKGKKEQPVYHFTSPIGAIGKYWQKAEMNITKDKHFSQKFLDP